MQETIAPVKWVAYYIFWILLAEASESHLEPQLCHLNSEAVFWLAS